MEQLQNRKQRVPWQCLLSLFYQYDVFLMFQTNSIMAQDNTNYLNNKKEVLVSVAWENIVSAHGATFSSPYFVL